MTSLYLINYKQYNRNFMNQKTILSTILLLFIFLAGFENVFSQSQVRVNGVVKDNSGQVLPGVTVKEKGTNNAVSTDNEGSFSIQVNRIGASLEFYFIGMNRQEVLVGEKNVLDITLTPANTALDDVVVIGYGSARRSDITSSISSVTASDIKNLPVAGIDQALQGKVAGVSVNTNGGQPGGGVSVRVRGLTSINGNEPLYVVDGIIIPSTRNTISQDKLGGMGGSTVQSGIAGLNPNDIEKIDVLKDASAQAIYGAQGANGVVLITTKRGKIGEGQINYEAYFGRQNTPKMLDLMDLSQFARYNNQVLEEISQVTGNAFTPIGEYASPDILGKGTDWQDAIFQSGTIQSHQLSFSGGQDKTNYYLSLNYFDQEGTIIGSGFDRYSMRFNLDHQIKDWVKVGVSSNVSHTNQRTTLTNGSDAIVNVAAFNSPAAPIYDISGEFAPPIAVGGYTFGNPVNPVAMAKLRDVTNKRLHAFGSVYADVFFTKHINLRNEVNYDYSNGNNMAFQPFLASGGITLLSPSKIVETRTPSLYWALRNYLNYNQTFGLHNVSAQIGHEAQESSWDNLEATRQNLALNIPSIVAGEQENQEIGGGKGEWAMESYFARAGYSYNDRYALNFSIRRDGSANFGPNKKIGYFPAGSFGWTISNESFASDWKWADYLKLRLGAGMVGNANTDQVRYATNIRLFATSPFGAGGIPQNVGNPDLGWETVITYNAGLDWSFLKRRIDVTFDIYKKRTTDMLMATKLPVFTGIGTEWNDIQSPWVNAGEMTNTGFDLGISSANIDKEDFKWNTSFVFSHYKNTLNKLNSESADLITYTEYSNAVILTRTVAGGPLGRFFGFKEEGVFKSEEEIRNHANQGLPISPTGTWLGDVKYADINDDGVIDDKDMTYIGDPNPDFTFGLTNTFEYKNFDLSIFLQGSVGGEILNYTRRSLETPRNVYWNQMESIGTDRYSELFNPDGTLPRYNQWHQQNLRVSSRMVENGSYLRLQNLTLGYNLPAHIANKAKMSNARIFVTGQNLITWSKYSGFDPELGSFNNSVLMQNVDLGNYPNPRTFTFGASFTF